MYRGLAGILLALTIGGCVVYDPAPRPVYAAAPPPPAYYYPAPAYYPAYHAYGGVAVGFGFGGRHWR